VVGAVGAVEGATAADVCDEGDDEPAGASAEEGAEAADAHPARRSAPANSPVEKRIIGSGIGGGTIRHF
jgi:hypothetical protein